MKKAKLTVLMSVLLFLVFTLPSRATGSLAHDCWWTSFWSEIHTADQGVGGDCDTLTTDSLGHPIFGGAGWCNNGRKIRPCNDDSCYTWVIRTNCSDLSNCTISGKLACSNGSLQAFYATCHSSDANHPANAYQYGPSQATCNGDVRITCKCGANGSADCS